MIKLKHKRYITYILSIFLYLIIFMMFFSVSVSAYSNGLPKIKKDKECSLKIGLSVSNIPIKIYKVADMDFNNKDRVFKPETDFATLSEEFEKAGKWLFGDKGVYTASNYNYLSKQCVSILNKRSIEGINGITDLNGNFQCLNMTPGLYLVIIENNSNNIQVDSFLISVPNLLNLGEESYWEYDVESYPKYEKRSIKPVETKKKENNCWMGSDVRCLLC